MGGRQHGGCTPCPCATLTLAEEQRLRGHAATGWGLVESTQLAQFRETGFKVKISPPSPARILQNMLELQCPGGDKTMVTAGDMLEKGSGCSPTSKR